MSQEAVVDNYVGQDKSAIAEAFGKAAATYDKHAEFQRDVGHRLLDKLPSDLSGLKVLDLGCGTGYFSEQLVKRGAAVVCADLSNGMLDEAKQRCGVSVSSYQQADAELLPFEDGHFDIVFSSLALQWCDDLSSPLREMKRVTAVSGRVIFSTLLDGSLFELKKSWSKIDAHQHVNHFITINQVKIALAQSSCTAHQLDLPTITVWYDTAFELMRDLKGIGANHVSGRSQGLTSRRMLQLVEREYREFKNHQGFLPATYQVCLGVIQL
ncbi:malonyl-ACP O-methyltransferase BioC [Vibrio lentus]|uniref:malonyl-ACP O-methyltransferase BioC n=1 Tax=Vibrio lentus TaxID=136468 RepID=UPI000976BEB6|nr:malonyl-ACP O-methyltransferase BioC [Vibrio lentus]MDH5927105.1 malonyl-ACP O-methyltransferase BioC [Vibrio lentus]OMO20273.1 malonyl-[acyl-carrier protein] O-methyltransferase BioC [Vibrio lentus]PMN11031.1 malonyl-[acyl-carrier protein] O-methyltransferase BioC [Vibrio lentus]